MGGMGDPNTMQEMMGNPLVQQMMNNPEMMKNMQEMMAGGKIDPNNPELADMRNNPGFNSLLKNKAMIQSMIQMVKDPKNTQMREMIAKQLPPNISVDTAIKVVEVILKVAGPLMVVKDVMTHKVTKLILFGLVIWFVASYLL